MEEQVPQVNRWIVSLSVVFATFMEVLDTTVVNVSLPHIAGSMSATVEEGTWTLTSYLVANAIILPMTGWLSNHFGRKRMLMSSVTGFTVASFLCGLAPNLPLLVIFRIIQGACGGGLQPSIRIRKRSTPLSVAFVHVGPVCAAEVRAGRVGVARGVEATD